LEKGKRVRVTAIEGRIYSRLKSSDPQCPREVRNWVDGPVWSWNDSLLTVEAEGPGPDWTLPFASSDRLETQVRHPVGARRGLGYGGPIGAVVGVVSSAFFQGGEPGAMGADLAGLGGVAEPAIFVDPISGAEISVFPENEEIVTGTLESIRGDSLFIHLDDFATAVPVLAWVGWWGW
jgi:hypothetical protein